MQSNLSAPILSCFIMYIFIDLTVIVVFFTLLFFLITIAHNNIDVQRCACSLVGKPLFI